jgi:hypothetical protein
MTVQSVREMLARRPLQPVRLTLSSGQSFEIRHPEMALLTRTSLLVGVDVADDGVPTEFKILLLLHVTAIEPLSSQAARADRAKVWGSVRPESAAVARSIGG